MLLFLAEQGIILAPRVQVGDSLEIKSLMEKESITEFKKYFKNGAIFLRKSNPIWLCLQGGANLHFLNQQVFELLLLLVLDFLAVPNSDSLAPKYFLARQVKTTPSQIGFDFFFATAWISWRHISFVPYPNLTHDLWLERSPSHLQNHRRNYFHLSNFNRTKFSIHVKRSFWTDSETFF